MRNARGFTTVEVMVAAALAGLLAVVAATVLVNTVGLEKKSAVQALADAEFAAGAQLAQNPARLAPYVNLAGLGGCLSGGAGAGCEAFQAWNEFPLTTGDKEPRFRAEVDLMGPCRPAKPCPVKRTMRYRWLCTATKCTGTEVEVKVTASEASRVRERSTLISIDRRQFVDRGQLQFLCDAAGESMVGVDYAKLRDRCAAKAASTCAGPHAFFTVGGDPGDCRPAYDQSCGNGFGKIGLDTSSSACL